MKKFVALASLLAATLLPTTAHAGPSRDWLSYHGGPQGTGLDTTLKSVDTSSPKWTSPVPVSYTHLTLPTKRIV